MKTASEKYIRTTPIICHQNYVKKLHQNDVHFLSIEIMSIKVHRIDTDFLLIRIA